MEEEEEGWSKRCQTTKRLNTMTPQVILDDKTIIVDSYVDGCYEVFN